MRIVLVRLSRHLFPTCRGRSKGQANATGLHYHHTSTISRPLRLKHGSIFYVDSRQSPPERLHDLHTAPPPYTSSTKGPLPPKRIGQHSIGRMYAAQALLYPAPVIHISLQSFYRDAENKTQQFTIPLSVRDTVPVTARPIAPDAPVKQHTSHARNHAIHIKRPHNVFMSWATQSATALLWFIGPCSSMYQDQ